MSSPESITPVTTLRNQWVAPSDIFSILLILGGDVIQLALASVSGRRLTPLSFSFGWVAYAVSAVLGTVGENRLIRCAPELSLLTFNLETGYDRDNKSWVLSRLLKTYSFWMPDEVKLKAGDYRAYKLDEEAEVASAPNNDQDAHRSALCVAVYDSLSDAPEGGGIPVRDGLWWSGIAMTVVQLGIAAVPFGLEGDWTIFLVTAAGSALAYASGSLPQWREEKWHARRLKDEKDVAITQGNGSRHVIVIRGRKGTLDLEDLAAGWTPDWPSTKVATFVLALLWFALLLTSTGIQNNTWYLLAVGGLGMLHNLMVAGWPRKPAALGLPIQLARTTCLDSHGQEREVPAVFGQGKVMWTLMELEEKFKGFGRSLVGEFFPGEMRSWEKKWWEEKDPLQRRRLLREAKEEFYAKKREKSSLKDPVQVVSSL